MKRLLLAFLCATSLAVAADSYLLPPEAVVDGATQGELSVRWWQWAGSFKYADSPVADTTGQKCAEGQRGDVFFLAGTYESKVTRRTCEVPEGKYLFFPIVNYMVMPASCNSCSDCAGNAATAKAMTDNPRVLFAELDGQSLGDIKRHRFVSPACFNLAARIFGAPPIEPVAANGYYLLLKPLPKGEHKLRFGAELPSLRQGLEYTLIVK